MFFRDMRVCQRVLACALVLWCSTAAVAQEVQPGGAGGPWAGIVPTPPEPPEVLARDDTGRATIRAVRIHQPLVVDGVLDETVYGRVAPVTGFIQQEPDEGRPSTENAEIWILFDDDHVYVSSRLWQDPEQIVATERRRDHNNLTRNDNFAVIFDTFRDRRGGFFFYTSAAGGMFDGLVTDESQNNREWNTIWRARTGRFHDGWTVEMAIPFRSLRYGPGRDQIWGVNFRRILLAKNELATLTPVPASYGNPGIMRVSLAATLVGLQVPPGARGLELKPYGIAGLTTDRTISPVTSNAMTGDAGLDLKYRLTGGLTFDFTYNPDFAQVEDDDQQVNLTRFSLFFPERRDFFLEGQGLFAFGGVRVSGTGSGEGNMPVLFFSRRIGLSDNRPVSLPAGARLTGRVGRYSVGLLNVQAGDDPRTGTGGTNFGIVRVRRDILRRSSVGFIATNRSDSLSGPGASQAVGVDTLLLLHRQLRINSHYAITRTPLQAGDNASYRVQLEYPADRYGLNLEHLAVGQHFSPEVGFLRRSGFRQNIAGVRFSPRPRGIDWIRKFSWEGRLDQVDGRERLETRETQAAFTTDFENGDSLSTEYTRSFEYLETPFRIAGGAVLEPGEYRFGDVRTVYQLGPQRAVSGAVTFRRGGFFSGDRTELGYDGRLRFGALLTVEPAVSLNWIDLPEGRFTTRLLRTRASVTFSPQTLLGTLVQYNTSTSTIALNLRFRWEYRPLSELFVVYSEGHDALGPGRRDLQNRGLAVKLTRMFRF